jgi:hypothetical protein
VLLEGGLPVESGNPFLFSETFLKKSVKIVCILKINISFV